MKTKIPFYHLFFPNKEQISLNNFNRNVIERTIWMNVKYYFELKGINIQGLFRKKYDNYMKM